MTDLTYTKTVPITAESEVIVVGGGPAGIAAAIASARNGAKTLLVEQYGFLGGMATAGLVGPFMTSYGIDGKEPIIEGIFRELVDRMVALGAAIDPAQVDGFSAYGGYHHYGHEHVTPFDPEALKYVAQEMCLQAGVQLKLHRFFLDALIEANSQGGPRIDGRDRRQQVGPGGLSRPDRDRHHGRRRRRRARRSALRAGPPGGRAHSAGQPLFPGRQRGRRGGAGLHGRAPGGRELSGHRGRGHGSGASSRIPRTGSPCFARRAPACGGPTSRGCTMSTPPTPSSSPVPRSRAIARCSIWSILCASACPALRTAP